MRVIRTRRGARIIHGRSVLSEIVARPGPTHSVFDVLAAVAALRPSRNVAMLGFAAGGMVAPLRALGSAASVRAVDLDLSKVPLFEELCGEWAGDVRVVRGDAAAWLRRQRSTFDVIIEDLSVDLEHDVTKPEVSFTALPALIRRRLSRRGLAVVNVLPLSGWTWLEVTHALVHPWGDSAAQIIFDEYVNRFVVVGHDVPSAAELGRALRSRLRSIRSGIAEKFSVERVRP